jgi:hypothetical protein
MKKIKFMLMSLALLAVVGGALAFKAKYTSTFCTTLATIVNNQSTCTYIDGAIAKTLRCPNQVANKTTDATDLDAAFYCTTPRVLVNNVLTCTLADGTGITCQTTSYATVAAD